MPEKSIFILQMNFFLRTLTDGTAFVILLMDEEVMIGGKMISQTTEYVLKALIYLAGHGDGKPILAKEIAEKVDIPKNYLSKLLYELKRAGILVADRGKTGGYRLAKAADDIKLADIVTLIEGSESYQGCFLKRTKCNAGDPCAAHSRWRPISNQIRSFLEETTIKELAV